MDEVVAPTRRAIAGAVLCALCGWATTAAQARGAGLGVHVARTIDRRTGVEHRYYT
jgi:hypothetical protein